jgi:hypothetical protein
MNARQLTSSGSALIMAAATWDVSQLSASASTHVKGRWEVAPR